MQRKQVEKREKIAVLLDGNNFYKGLEKSDIRSRFDLNLFDYEKLIAFIAGNREVIFKGYYKGVVKKEEGNEKSQRMVSEQQRIFSNLEKYEWKIGRGRMSKNTEFGECEGFYFLDQNIKNNEQLKIFSEEILKEHQFHYKPIVIISNNNHAYKKLQEALGGTKDNGKELKISKGIYFALNRWREKGVDVNMAVDMLDIAYQSKIKSDIVDTISIISNDSDLKPVIEKVKSLGVNVQYIGFEHMYSIALLNIASERLLLTTKQLEEFLPKTLI